MVCLLSKNRIDLIAASPLFPTTSVRDTVNMELPSSRVELHTHDDIYIYIYDIILN